MKERLAERCLEVFEHLCRQNKRLDSRLNAAASLWPVPVRMQRLLGLCVIKNTSILDFKDLCNEP